MFTTKKSNVYIFGNPKINVKELKDNLKLLINKAMKPKVILTILFISIVAIFSVQNYEVSEVKFLFWKITLSRVLIILGSFCIGILVGILISFKKSKNKAT